MTERSAYLSDAAAARGERVRDDLRFSDFRPALVEILRTAQTPLTLGVFGPWGSGKTSLLRMLRHDLAWEHGDEVETVWFTAWKYDRQEALWRAFILRVLDALQPAEHGEEATEEDHESRGQLVKHLERLEESVYREVEWTELGRLVADWSQLLPQAGKAAGALAAAFIPGGELVRKMLGELAGGGKAEPDLPKAAGAIRREMRRHYRAQLASMEQFERGFEEALGLALPGRRLVVFVDDLDRCLPEKAIEVLEAIKLFLEVPGTEFVLGMDAGVVERGIEVRYGRLFRAAAAGAEAGERGELPISGSAYLQKIVQIPFHLPALGLEDLEGFIEGLERDAAEGAATGEITRGVIARGVLPNPRQVKRTLNMLRLLEAVARTREAAGGLEAGAITEPLLAKTVLIQSQWPGLYQEWRLRPTLLRTLEEEFLRRPSSEEEILRGRVARAEREREPGVAEGAGEEGEGAPEKAREAPSGGILGPYLRDRRRYALLERMLAFPPAGEERPGGERARFAELEPQELEAYTRLAGAIQPTEGEGEKPGAPAAPTDLMAEMLSGDTARVREAVARLESEEEPGGPVHERVRSELQSAIRSPTRPARERAGAGEALGRLGDPRFAPERWWLPGDESLGFVAVPAGEFPMGSDPEQDGEAYGDEQPQSRVEVPGLWIARFPVTAAQFRAYAKESGEKALLERVESQIPNQPVVEVTWHEARAYCSWLGERLKAAAPDRAQAVQGEAPNAMWAGIGDGSLGVGLPSEAEWEKAARWDGERSRIYPWGDSFDPERASTEETGLKGPSAVGCFPQGAGFHGCEEMSGNVWEWTRSLWGEEVEKPKFGYPYVRDDGRESLEAPDEVLRVLRGGSFFFPSWNARCAYRLWVLPYLRYFDVGFRLVLSPFFSEL